MTDRDRTCLPMAVWFLVTEQGEPMGQVYRSGEDSLPAAAAARIDRDGTALEVVGFTELQATCAMRRFRMVVRVLK